eukprot:7970108-Pyramimonas_sp.AAC.1
MRWGRKALLKSSRLSCESLERNGGVGDILASGVRLQGGEARLPPAPPTQGTCAITTICASGDGR